MPSIRLGFPVATSQEHNRGGIAMRRILAVLAAAALVAACSDQPTAVDRAGGPQFGVNNLERSGYELIWEVTMPEDQAWGGYYLPSCTNDGQGEEAVSWGGPYQYWARIVATPSGRQNENGYILVVPGGSDNYKGIVTGDVWTTTSFESKLGYHYFADGRLMLTQPVAATYTNQRTGERMYMRNAWHWIQDAEGNIVGGNFRIEPISCRLLR